MKDKDLIARIVAELIQNNIIPIDPLFEIKEEQLVEYINLYNKYKSVDNGLGVNTKSNYRYARKLAGLTLLKFKIERGAKANQCKEGFVYTVSNPAWPSHLKLGMSVDIKKRLRSYQTYSPYRDYKIKRYEFVFNRREVEQTIINTFNKSLEAGEWFKNTEADRIIQFIENHWSKAN